MTTSPLNPPIYAETNNQNEWKETLSQRFNLPIANQPPGEDYLLLNEYGLSFISKADRVQFDLNNKTIRFRSVQSKKNDALAKALRIKQLSSPRIIDATAGAGIDATLMAYWGSPVRLIERQPIIAALLADAIARLPEELSDQLTLIHGESEQLLPKLCADLSADIIYLDPMFLHPERTAKSKKTILSIQKLVSLDDGGDSLLPIALACATHRVVVKRPIKAPPLDGQNPNFFISMKKHRFDVYVRS